MRSRGGPPVVARLVCSDTRMEEKNVTVVFGSLGIPVNVSIYYIMSYYITILCNEYNVTFLALGFRSTFASSYLASPFLLIHDHPLGSSVQTHIRDQNRYSGSSFPLFFILPIVELGGPPYTPDSCHYCLSFLRYIT